MAASTALQVLVSPFLGTVFENLGSLIQKEIGLVSGVKKELVKLSNTLSTIRDVIDDAEAKQIDDKPIYNWLRRLKDLAYEADDILDECATKAFIPGSDIAKNNTCNIQVTSPSDSSCFDFKGIMFRRSIGKRIKELREKFDEMADERIKFHLNLMIPGNVESRRKEKRETSSFLSEPQVYGREEEKEHISNLLLNEGTREDVSICCIVGMGGLGKTTLAQMVYNDEKIINHFQLRCWVCVSDPFVLKTLLKSIIESTGGNARDLEDLDPLQRRIQGILSGKKFLLVLDDVWNEDKTKWHKLKSLLTCGGIGCSIIVTTRLESVASMTSTLPIWRPKFLSDEDCWSLFKHYAFDSENEKYHPMLEEIGKQIMKKCKGVPLAAKALGGLLCFKKTENEWLFVRDSALWDLPQDKEDAILPALRLSYNHLPSQLKQCYSFCSIFPKDYKIVKDDLIHLWMANGFVQPKENMGLEDIGNGIFNELLWRSFFQDATKDEYGDIRDCKMHDLVHDLACSITVNEFTVVEVGKDENAFKGIIRHLALQFGDSSSSTNTSNLFPSQSQPLLRTFLLGGSPSSNRLIQGLTYSNFKRLRVLDLHWVHMKTLHVSVGHLKHLRYLDLSRCQEMISFHDESICNLKNLQVLKLNYCHNLQRLPRNMRKLTNLRHLDIRGCYKLRRMPVGMGNLSSLRTLNMFVVVPEVGRGITELSGLDHLTGELKIQGLEHVRNSKDAKNAHLLRKKNLRVLTLFWSDKNNGTILEEEEEEVVASIGEGLQPHPNVKKLHLKCYNGLSFPSWMSHSCLPNLVKIYLCDCRRCEHLPPLGQLPLLEILSVSGMDSVKCIGDEFYGDHHHPHGSSFFPTLKELLIGGMANLEEWYASSSQVEENIRVRRREGGGELPVVFPSLERLTLSGCPKLRTLPTTLSSSLKKLDLIDCNEMLMILESCSSLESLPPPNSSSCLNSLVKVVGCLQSLDIISCDKIETLPYVLLENLSSTLTELHIYYCNELVCLPEEMQNLTCLKTLQIHGCGSLKYLPELGSRSNSVMTKLSIQACGGLTSVSDCLRHLTTLENLVISGTSPELEFLPDDFQDLTSLRHLHIMCLPRMTCLPEGLQQVAGTLESLQIYRCSGMTSLPEWMYKFTSLRSLSIQYCGYLKVLPEQMLRLTALVNVTIHNCHPDLHRRYAKEMGEDWHKIAHIPDLTITETAAGRDVLINTTNIITYFASSSSDTN